MRVAMIAITEQFHRISVDVLVCRISLRQFAEELQNDASHVFQLQSFHVLERSTRSCGEESVW